MSGLNLLVRGEPGEFSPGIAENVARPQYDAIPALNCSTLKKWIEIVVINGGCPKKFGHWLRNRDDKRSEALIIGSALDCLILEPDAFTEKFIVLPGDAPKRPSSVQRNAKKPSPETIAAIAWWDSFAESAAGKDVLDPDQHRMVMRMAEAATTSPLTCDVFQHCAKRVITTELNGIPCKGEVDLFSDKTEYLFDLKTTRDASLKPFSKQAWELGYQYQAAFYLKMAQSLGLTHKTAFAFVAVENVEPHCVAAYTIDFTTDSLQYAWKMIQTASIPLMQCLNRNEWPDYGDFTPMKFPGFAKKEAMDFLQE